MDECIFCKIVKKEIPSLRVFENDGAIAMLDVKPLAPAHVVVVPKNHVDLVENMNDSDMENVFSAVRTAVGMIKNSDIKPDGFTIGINNGKAAGQFVPHVHIHIIPRFEKDGGGSIHTIVSNPPKEDIQAIFNKVVKGKLTEVKPAEKEEVVKEPVKAVRKEEESPSNETLEEKRKRLEKQLGL